MPLCGTGGPNEGAGSGCGYHAAVNINSSVDSIQRNAQFGVPDSDLPPIFDPAGVHVEVFYHDGQIDVFMTGNDGGERMQVLGTTIPALPAGDVVLGFTGGTGGANATQEIDNFVLSTICREDADSVAIEGCPEGEVADNETVTLTANVGGAEGDVTYNWEVTGGAIVSGAGTATVEVSCEAGEVTVTVTASDAECGNSVSDACSFTCVSSGILVKPGDFNLDGVITLTDPIRGLNDLFSGQPLNACLREADGETPTAFGLRNLDWDGNGIFNISDNISLLGWLFLEGGTGHVLGVDCIPVPGEGCPDSCTP